MTLKINNQHTLNTHTTGGPRLRVPWQFFTYIGTLSSSKVTVYLLHELKVPGPSKGKDQAKNKRQFSNPWQAECSEGDGSGHEMPRRSALPSVKCDCANMWQFCLAASRMRTWWGTLKKSDQNLSFLIWLRASARPLHAFPHSKTLWKFISVAEFGLGINSKWQSSQ